MSVELKSIYRAIDSLAHVKEQNVRNGEGSRRLEAGYNIEQFRWQKPPVFKRDTNPLEAGFGQLDGESFQCPKLHQLICSLLPLSCWRER